jgi:hypothetical protein
MDPSRWKTVDAKGKNHPLQGCGESTLVPIGDYTHALASALSGVCKAVAGPTCNRLAMEA